MIQNFGSTSRRVLTGFGRFSPGQKAATICTVLALAVGGYFFASWASRPSFAPLYSNLSGTDASAIVDKLNAGGTPYRLADGGQTVLVPQDKVYDLRLAMSGAGLPAGKDTGYALLDKQGVTTSEFMQHVGYQRALEGELANTIDAIDGVSSATVHLAMPQKDVFTDDQQKPTASVLVATGQGSTLSPDQVQAVVHLVSSSVVGLTPDEVTVADSTGRVLSAGGGSTASYSDGSGGSAITSSLTQAYQQRVNASLQQMLDQVVGPGHAAVNVTADLNFDQTNTKSETYTNDPKLPPLSQTSTSETYNGPGLPGTGTAAGVLGPDNVQVPIGGNVISNNTGTNSSTTPTGKYAKTSSTRDNAVGVVTQTVQAAPGTVRRLSVAVLLDSSTSSKLDKAALEQLVSAAVGLNTKRGDTMAVTALPFDGSVAAAAKSALDSAKKADQRNQLISMAKQVGAALIVLLLLFGAWRSSKKKKQVALSDEERAQLEEMQAALENARVRALTAGGAETPALEAGGGPLRGEEERIARQDELSRLVDRQPEEVASLLRGWLADKKG